MTDFVHLFQDSSPTYLGLPNPCFVFILRRWSARRARQTLLFLLLVHLQPVFHLGTHGQGRSIREGVVGKTAQPGRKKCWSTRTLKGSGVTAKAFETQLSGSFRQRKGIALDFRDHRSKAYCRDEDEVGYAVLQIVTKGTF